MKERLYLGGFEIYREYAGDGLTVTLERETLHVMDDQQRISLVETKTVDLENGSSLTPAIRYQLGNHLSSASLELDNNGAVISYEEYHPYGTTSYQAGRSVAEVGLKRYRYTGMEKDEETGLSYHGARYYAPWLGRWTAVDPIGIGDGVNLYSYAQNRPSRYFDLKGFSSCDPDDLSCTPDETDGSEYGYSTRMTEEDQTSLDQKSGDTNVPEGKPYYEAPNYNPPEMSTAQAVSEGVVEGGKAGLVGVAIALTLPTTVTIALGGFALGYFLGSGEAEKTAESIGRTVTGEGSAEDIKTTTAFATGTAIGLAVGGGTRRTPKTPKAPKAQKAVLHSRASSTSPKGSNLKDLMKNSQFKPTQSAKKMDLQKINEYAELMEKGKWDWSIDKIIVDKNGNLMSGHHRVVAAAKAKVEIPESAIFRLETETLRLTYSWSEILP